MNHPWPAVPLGEVLKHRKEFITIDDSQEYKRCRIQLHAKGIVLRDLIEGARIKTKEQQVCRAGEFLVAEIDAKVGGFGIVPEGLDGAIVSSHYFLFEIDQLKLDKGFLDYYIRTPTFRDQVSARGTTNYAAIRPRQVLEYSIPLPPLPEQRRIVAKIEALAARVGEANGLRHRAIRSTELILGSALYSILSPERISTEYVSLGEIADIKAGVTLGRINLRGPLISLPYLRVANVQDGHLDLSFVKEIEILEDEKEKWLLQDGDILLTEGGDWDKLGRGTVWRNEIPNCIHQNHIFRVRVNQLDYNPYFLCVFIGSPYGKSYFQEASKQTTNLASINQRQLKAFRIPRLPINEQHRIVAYLDGLQARVDALKKLQGQTAAELDALLPAILDRAFKGEL
jgi:type I restriction enzyme S subunit